MKLLLLSLALVALAGAANIKQSILAGHVAGESYHLILSPDTSAVLSQFKHTKFATREQHRSTINGALKSLTAAAQKDVLPILQKHADRTPAFTYKPLWIINQVILTNPTPALLQELASVHNVVDIVKEIIFTIPEEDLITGNASAKATGYWQLDAQGAEEAWGVTDGAGVVIAVLDTGINNGHEQFEGRIVAQHNAISGGASAEDDNGHGTHCAGIAAGSSSGFAPKASIIAVKALNAQGSGTSANIIDGVEWIADASPAADVLSLSLGAASSLPGLENALNVLHNAGTAVVAAAGNTGCGGGASYPASYENVWSIGAVKESLQWDNSYSWCGIFGAKPDACAGGSLVKSAWIGGDAAYNTISGTSMACPGAAGIAALVRSANPGLSNSQIKDHLLDNTIDVATGGTCGAYSGPNCCNERILHAGQALTNLRK